MTLISPSRYSVARRPKRKLCSIFIDFWWQIRCLWNKFRAKSTSLPEIFSDVSSHLWRRLSITCRATKRMVWRYRTNLRDFRHRRTLGIYKQTWKRAKIGERNSTTCKGIFHQLTAKNLNVNVVQRSTVSVIRYSTGKKKSYIIHLFDRPKSGFVRAKKYLAGHHDRRPAVRYFEPWFFEPRNTETQYTRNLPRSRVTLV